MKDKWNERKKRERVFLHNREIEKFGWNFVKSNQVESNTRCANINQFENYENR